MRETRADDRAGSGLEIKRGVAGLSLAAAVLGGLLPGVVSAAGSVSMAEVKPAPMLLAQAGGASARPSAAVIQAELEALIKAAKAEGELTFYSTATENVAKRAGDAFTAKYGIKTAFIRMGGTQMRQRYSSEAEAGNVVADLMLNAGGNTVAYAEEHIRKGVADAISQAGLPVIRSGEFPARFITGPTAIIQIAPWLITYNTDKVKGEDIPKDWNGLLNPKFKGQILIPNPASSDSYIDLWVALLDKYGENFYAQLRAQAPRQYPSGVPAVQALGAGEGAMAVPAVPALVTGIAAKGAPLAMAPMEFTTGVEMQVMLSSRAKSKRPNAGRLFANYLMTPEGNQVFNNDPGGVTMYDTSRLPRQYESPKANALARRDLVTKLLGMQ